MNSIQTATNLLAVIALAVMGASCASDTQNKQNLAVAAGFQSHHAERTGPASDPRLSPSG